MKIRHTPLSIESHQAWLEGMLAHSPDVHNLVIVAHTGTDEPHEIDISRLAEALHASNSATLCINLLSADEQAHIPDAAYNIAELEHRIFALAEWGRHQPIMAHLHQSLILSGTACAAGIRAASLKPWLFNSLICLEGRPDLAGRTPLNSMKVPVRFIVSQNNPHRATLHQAFSLINGPGDWHLLTYKDETVNTETIHRTLCQLTTEWIEKHPAPLPHTEQPDIPAPVLHHKKLLQKRY